MAEAQGLEGHQSQLSDQPAGDDVVANTLTYLARSLVAYPDDVSVTQGMGERGLTYTLRVHPEDVGRVIGRSGRMARALRQVTRAAGARVDVHAFIEITES